MRKTKQLQLPSLDPLSSRTEIIHGLEGIARLKELQAAGHFVQHMKCLKANGSYEIEWVPEERARKFREFENRS